MTDKSGHSACFGDDALRGGRSQCREGEEKMKDATICKLLRSQRQILVKGDTIRPFPLEGATMARLIRFGVFELDASAYELRRGSRVVKMERLAMELLLLLIARRGELVSRDEIVEKLWGKDVFLDAEHGVNTAVRKVRRALGDRPQRPRFVQTTPGKGYRFIAAVRHGTAQVSERMMLAVLPFLNLSGDPADEYLSDGLTEETIARLGSMHPGRLGVIARTSSMAYKGTNKSARQIGQELHVDYLLESSIRRQDQLVRITAQLILAKDETHLWARTYDRSGGSFLGLQGELARAIAEQIRIKLTREQKASLVRTPTSSPEAFDTYLRGRFCWNHRRREMILRAIQQFEEALAMDPHYSLAWAGVADAYAILPITSDAPSEECFPKAMTAARRAILADDLSVEAHTALGSCKFWMEWDWKGAQVELRRAIELNPSYALAHLYYAHVLSNSGDHAAADKEISNARELDPLSPHVYSISGQLLFQAGRYGDATVHLERALALNPQAWIANIVLARIDIEAGRFNDAISRLQLAYETSGGTTEALSLKGYAYAKSGHPEQAQQVIATLLEIAKHRYVPPYNIGLVFQGLGETARAIEWLGKAYQQRDVRMVFLGVDPKWKELNRDARVRNLWPHPAPLD
jgi:TolB-like protein/Tfp pilus assembly protein PilF